MIHFLVSLLIAMQSVTPQERIEHARSVAPVTCSASGTFTLPTGTILNDFLLIQGSGTKTVHWVYFEKQCSIASAPSQWTNVMARRTSETGGTPTNLTNVSHDPNNAVCTATVTHYAAGVPAGNSGGSAFYQRYFDRLPVNSAATFNDITRDTWGISQGKHTHSDESSIGMFGYSAHGEGSGGGGLSWRPVQPLTLRGTSDILALTTSASFVNAITCFVSFEWYEDNL